MQLGRSDEAQHPLDRAAGIVEHARQILADETKASRLDPVVASLLAAQKAIGAADFDRKLFVLELEDVMRRYALLAADRPAEPTSA